MPAYLLNANISLKFFNKIGHRVSFPRETFIFAAIFKKLQHERRFIRQNKKF